MSWKLIFIFFTFCVLEQGHSLTKYSNMRLNKWISTGFHFVMSERKLHNNEYKKNWENLSGKFQWPFWHCWMIGWVKVVMTDPNLKVLGSRRKFSFLQKLFIFYFRRLVHTTTDIFLIFFSDDFRFIVVVFHIHLPICFCFSQFFTLENL